MRIRMLASLLAIVMVGCSEQSPTAPTAIESAAMPAPPAGTPSGSAGGPVSVPEMANADQSTRRTLTVQPVDDTIAPGEDAEFTIAADGPAPQLLNIRVDVNERRRGGVGIIRPGWAHIQRGQTSGTYTVETIASTTRVNLKLHGASSYVAGTPSHASVDVAAEVWPASFRVNASTNPPRIEWNAHPNATGYTVEFHRPVQWSGRMDGRYAPMSNSLFRYTMRAKAHTASGDTEWTDWFVTCRPPTVRQGGNTMSTDKETANECDAPSGGDSGSPEWTEANLHVNAGTSPPQIEWDAYPNATGYTVQFTRPMHWSGRKDRGYAEMSHRGPKYTMRVKAHLAGGAETAWTDWINTCRPPRVHDGDPADPPSC